MSHDVQEGFQNKWTYLLLQLSPEAHSGLQFVIDLFSLSASEKTIWFCFELQEGVRCVWGVASGN